MLSGAEHSFVSGLVAPKRELAPDVHFSRCLVFSADGNLRRGGDDRVFPAVPKRRTALGGADGPGRRGGADGGSRDFVLQGAGFVAPAAGNWAGPGGTVPAARARWKIAS